MSLRFLFTVFLFVSLSLAGIGQTVSSPTIVSPASGLQGNSGYVIGPIGNGQVAASTVTFASPAPTAGISEAGFAGISDHTPLPQGVQSTLPPSTVVVSSAGAPTVFYANQSAPSAVAAPETAPETSVSNLAPSVYAGTNTSAPASASNASLSLGEVAAQNKTHNGAQRAHSYTNADVQNLISRRGGGNIMEAANRAPSGVLAPAQNPLVATTSTVPPQNTNSGTAPGSAQSAARSANGSSAQEAPAARAGNSASQTAPSNGVQQNAGTTPQIRQTRPEDKQENNQQLPATSTILPLLGLIGLVSSGLGLWFRKSR
jgi:hypothetical protein